MGANYYYFTKVKVNLTRGKCNHGLDLLYSTATGQNSFTFIFASVAREEAINNWFLS